MTDKTYLNMSTYDNSDDYLTLVNAGCDYRQWEDKCQPCGQQGHAHLASSYCRTCAQFLCHSCYTVHLLPPAQRGHQMVDLREVPDQCRDLTDNLESLRYTSSETVQQFKSAHQKASQCNIDALKKFKDFKKQVIGCLEKAEGELAAQTKAKDEENSSKLQQVYIKCEPVTEEASKILNSIESLYPTKEKFNLPEVIRVAKPRVPELQRAMGDARATGSLQQLHFQPNLQILGQLTGLVSLGKVCVETAEVVIPERPSRPRPDRDSGYMDIDYVRHNAPNQNNSKSPGKEMKPPPLPYRDDSLPRNASFASQKSCPSDRYVAGPVGRSMEDQGSGGTMASFRSCQEDQVSLKSVGSGGSQMSRLSEVTSYLMNVNVKARDDKSTPCISGSVSLDMETLIVTDFKNKKVKLINTQKCYMENYLKTPSSPWDLTVIQDNTVGVTVPNEKKIFLLNCKRDIRGDRALIKEGTISVKGFCRGIVYTNISASLIVTYAPYKQLGGPTKIEIMDLKGIVRKIISLGKTFGELSLSNPVYVATNRDQDVIYVSDWSKESVCCLRLDGTQLASYIDPRLKEPYKVTSGPDDTIYVCGIKSNNIHKVSSSCRRSGVIISDGLKSPISVCYCFGTGKLFVGMQESDDIKVYQIGTY